MKKLIFLLAMLLIVPLTFNLFAQTLSEGFENQSNFPPNGWEVIYGDNKPDINTVNQSGDEHYQGLFSFEFRSYSETNPYDQYLITPKLLVSEGDQSFSFWYKRGSNSTETFRIGWSSTGKELSDFTWSDDVTNANNNWQRHLKTGLPVGTKYVVIHYKSVNKYNLFVDDVFGPALYPSIPPNPARYPNPGDNATEVPATASLNWQSSIIGEVTTGYKLYFGTNNPPTNIENGVDLGDISTYDPAGDLAYNTKYYWRVVPYNPIGDASYCPVWSFTTMSDPTITSFPYTQAFEGAVPPTDWQEVRTPASSGYGWASSNSGLSGKCARFDSYYNSPGNISRLITPPFNLSALSTAQLTFNYKNPKGGDFSVLLSTDGGLSYPNVILTGLTNQADWTEKTANISAYIGSNVKIAFKGISNYGSDDAYIYLDNMTIDEMPSCPAPTALTASNILAHSADIGWTENSSATTWQIEYKAGADFTPGTGADESIEVTSNPFSLTGLESSTKYYWYVKAKCGAADDSYWAGQGSFTTEFGPKTTPYFEGFEIGNTYGEIIGNQWAQAPETGYKYRMWRAYNNALSYNRSPRTGDWNAVLDNINEQWMFQRLSLEGGKEYTFEMYANHARNSSEPQNSSITIKYGLLSTQAAMTETIGPETTILNEEYQLITGAFTPSVSGDYSIGIFGKTNNHPNISIDDIAIYETPNCPAPLALNESQITINSAKLGWTERGVATTWNIKYGTSDFNPANTGEGTLISVTENPYTLTGLAENSTHYWYVQADCGSDQSTWVGPNTFTTLKRTSAPYSQGFETTATPEDWTIAGWTIGTTNSSNIPPHDGNYIYTHLNQANPLKVFTTNIIGPVSDLMYFSFDYAQNFPSGLDVYGGVIVVSVSSDYGQTYTIVETIENTSLRDWQFKSIAINGYGGKNLKIKIEGTVNLWNYHLALDNLNLTFCPAPSALTASNIRGNSADLGWTENGGATAWNIKYGAAGFDPDTEGTLISGVDSNPYTLSHLLRETTYDCYVQAACGDDDESFWARPHSFTTVPTPMATPYFEGFEHGHSHAGVIANGWTQERVQGYANWAANNKFTENSRSPRSGSWNAYLYKGSQQWMFQKIYLEDGKNYTFDMYARRENDGISSIEVKYGSEDNELSMQHRIKVKSLDAGDYQLITGTFTPASTGIYAIGILGYVNNYTMLAIDDIAIYETPDCHAPYESFVSNVTGTTADLSWTKRGSETSWNIKYGTVGFNPANAGEGTLVSNVNANPYVLSGLQSNTTYDWYVQAACSEDETSTWTGPKSFTTECGPVSVPYFESFDDITVPALPRCMSEINANGDNKKWVTDDLYAHSAPNAALIATGSIPMNDWLFTEGLWLEAGKTYELGFAYGSSENYQEKLSVYWGANASVAGMTEMLFSNLETYGREWHTKAASLSPSVTGTYYIGFHGYSDANQYFISLDDIYVVEQVATATWSGEVDNNWNNPGNWAGGTMPDATLDVVIPTSSSKYPIISAAAFCKAISLQSGSQLTIATNGKLTVDGDLTNNGKLSLKTGATILTNADIVGEGTNNIEQTLASDRNWWYLSSALSASSTGIFSQNGDKIGKHVEDYLNDGDAATTAPYYTNPFTSPFENFELGRGYVLKRAATTEATYTFTGGSLNNGDITLSPTRTGTSAGSRGFNLVGNPYPSYLNWEMAYKTATNMRSTIWYRTLHEGSMAFYTFNAASMAGTFTATQNIPPMQAYWVKVDADPASDLELSTGTLNLTNAMRSHDTSASGNPLKVRAANKNDRQIIRLEVSNGTLSDETVIVAHPLASDSFDKYDSEKMSNNDANRPEIYSQVGKQELVINGVSEFVDKKEFALGFRPGKAGNFSIALTEWNSSSDTELVLVDKVAKTERVLTTDSPYSFASDATATDSRFSLIYRIKGSVTGLDQPSSSLLVYTVQGSILVQSPDLIGATVSVFNTMGQALYNTKSQSTTLSIDQGFLPGVYLVKVNNELRKVSVK